MSSEVISIRPKALTSPGSFSALEQNQLTSWAVDASLPQFRGRQLFDALNRRCVQTPEEITEFPETLRIRLLEERPLRSVHARLHLRSSRDGSEKVLFALNDDAAVESVLIPSGNGNQRRYTVCVSSQVGCPAACSFCATGLGGFLRNLNAAEIADQVLYFAHALRLHKRRVSNVVFMGMGEPLLNTREVSAAISRLINPRGFALGARHITVSTVGIVPQIQKFADWAGQVNLAISLHAPNDELRSNLVPFNRRFPIEHLMGAVEAYIRKSGRRVSFEYVLLKGVNDHQELARELRTLLKPFGGLAHVNLIPWNPFEEGRFVRSEGPDAETFVRVLKRGGINATIRYSKGIDISAACGQLRDEARRQTGEADVLPLAGD